MQNNQQNSNATEIRGAYTLEEIEKTNKMLNMMRERSRTMRKVLRRLQMQA